MSRNIKFKKNMFLITAIFAVFLCFLSSTVFMETFADSAEDAEKEYNEAVDKYIGDIEDPGDLLDKMMKDAETNRFPERNSIQYVIQRLFHPGIYVNNVKDGVLDTDLGVSKDDLLINGYACNPNEPNNLLNHNCNIPNFTTELLQNIISPWESAFNNAGKTSATSAFGLGVPNGIPGGEVPVSIGQREHTYTALELFGYDLKLTSYNGEWDKITVSTKARMLSNFGIIDHTKLLGTALWDSASSGLSEFIQGFNFTSDRFGRPISGFFEGFASEGLNTTIDTSDLNVLASRSWKREKLNDSLYNVYVLSDKEVITETAKKYYREWIAIMKGNTEVSPELLEVLALSSEHIPGFTYVEDWETPESIKAREEAEAHNAEEERKLKSSQLAIAEYDNASNGGTGYTPGSGGYSPGTGYGPGMGGVRPSVYIPKYVVVPEPIYYTEKEQLGFWADENVTFLNRARAQGLISNDKNDLETYDEVVATWKTNWEQYSNKEFAASGEVVQDLLKKSDKNLYVNNPHLDSRQAISHYVCSNEDGVPLRKENGDLVYLYLKNNKGSTQSVNPECKAVRSPIGGGYFGDGWHIERPLDTRHKDLVNDTVDGGILLKTVSNLGKSIFRSLNSFIAKVTNVILGLSFSPILSKLGIDVIVTKLVEGFRDTIFFPMSALAAALGGLLLFFQLLKNGSAWQLVSSVFITFLIFIMGAMFLLRPNTTMKFVDEFPSKIDNFIANIVLADEQGSNYCSTGETNDGIRSAQCNVWGAMVFNPWVHLQFGTSYDNLYANGLAPSYGKEMQNTNELLVGDALVDMGNGVTENNWALYQLSKTKAGTITTSDTSVLQALGKVDKDLYRIVDLQAGPNNGAGTDSRYFKNWSGGNNGTVGATLLSFIQAITTSIAIILLGFKKIEVSFMFALSLILLPIMLLYSLLPQGKQKLKSYLASLGSLLIKRVTVTLMLGVFLRLLNGISANADNLVTASFAMTILSISFIIYRKELLDLIGSTESGGFASQVKETIVESVPKEVKQRYQMGKANAKGLAAGFAGGYVGAVSYNRETKKNKARVSNKVNQLRKKAANTGLSEEEKKKLNMLEISESELKRVLEANKASGATSNFAGAISGTKNASSIIGRRQERKIRKEGFSMFQISSNAKDEVIAKGQKDITDNLAPTESDVYKDIVSTGDGHQNTKTNTTSLNEENASLLLNKKVQKLVREEADKRRESIKKDKDADALSNGELDMGKLRDIIEARRKANRTINKVVNPKQEKRRREEFANRKDATNVTSSVEDIKEQIVKHQEDVEKEKQEKVNDNKVNKDTTSNKQKPKERITIEVEEKDDENK